MLRPGEEETAASPHCSFVATAHSGPEHGGLVAGRISGHAAANHATPHIASLILAALSSYADYVRKTIRSDTAGQRTPRCSHPPATSPVRQHCPPDGFLAGSAHLHPAPPRLHRTRTLSGRARTWSGPARTRAMPLFVEMGTRSSA